MDTLLIPRGRAQPTNNHPPAAQQFCPGAPAYVGSGRDAAVLSGVSGKDHQ